MHWKNTTFNRLGKTSLSFFEFHLGGGKFCKTKESQYLVQLDLDVGEKLESMRRRDQSQKGARRS